MEKRSRSPRYPNINLQDAIEKVRVIYQREHIHKVNREVIAKDLGYAGINGASASIISSIKQFGLLESIGSFLKVTDDAVIILELPQNDPERIEAVKRLAFTPSLFAEIYQEFGDKLPSDETLRLSLVKKGFNSKAANIVIRSYRETFSIIENESNDFLANNSSNTNLPANNFSGNNQVVPPNIIKHPLYAKDVSGIVQSEILTQKGAFTEDLQYRVSDECKVRILFDGNVTREAVKKLIAYLELGLDDFPQKYKDDKKIFYGTRRNWYIVRR